MQMKPAAVIPRSSEPSRGISAPKFAFVAEQKVAPNRETAVEGAESR